VIDALGMTLLLSGLLILHLSNNSNLAKAVGTVAIFVGGTCFQATRYRRSSYSGLSEDTPTPGTPKRPRWLWIVSGTLVPVLGWALYYGFDSFSRGGSIGAIYASLGAMLLCAIFWTKLANTYRD
jgi:hypothetical protein